MVNVPFGFTVFTVIVAGVRLVLDPELSSTVKVNEDELPLAGTWIQEAFTEAVHDAGNAQVGVNVPTPFPPSAPKLTLAGERVSPVHGAPDWLTVKVPIRKPLPSSTLNEPLRADVPVFAS